MAKIQYSRYEKGIDLQDHSSSYSSNAGAIYLSGTYMNFRTDLSLNSSGISNMSDPESAQDAATKAYVDAQITAQDLDFQGDTGGALSIDLDSETLTIAGTANEIETAGSGNTLTIGLPDSVTIGDALTVTGLLTANGSVDLGNATSDTITATGRFDSDLVPSTDSARKLGSSALQWSELHVDVGYIDRLAAAMDCDSQAMTNVNVDSGNIDGTIIGAASRAAASVTTLDANSTLNADGAATFGSTVSGSGAAQFASLHCDSVNLDGGNMDGVAIGAAARSTAQFTTVDANSTLNASGAATFGSTVSGSGAAQFASLHCDSVNLDGGNIDGMTIATSDVTVGAGKTLDVSAGTLTTSAAQKLAIMQGAASNVDIGSYDLRAATLTADGLTSGRVVFAGANGVLSDDSDMSFSGDTLTVTKLGAFQAAGAIDFDDQNMTNVDIDSGAMDGVVIGAASAAAASFTTVNASGQVSGSAAGKFLSLALNTDSFEVDSSGNLDSSGYVIVDGRGMFGGRLDVTGAFVAKGNVELGDATSDTITATGRFASDLVPSTDGARDLGSSALEWKDLYLDGVAYMDAVEADTLKVADLTDNRLVIAGASGELEDSANLTYDGTTFDIAAAVSVDGNITLDNDHDVKARAFITYSDVALKENVETVTNAMEMIQGLRGVSYDLKSGGKREFGFIAQEVNNVVPEVVHTNDGMMGIDYTRITSLLVEAVKSQQIEIAALKAKLDK